jgi:RHS repeat-associated protein
MLKEDKAPEIATYPPIWESEVESINGRVLMYPHYERSQINKITVHNPDNAKFGEQYVTWGFYKYTGPEKNDDGLIPGEFYLQNYEYAPFGAVAVQRGEFALDNPWRFSSEYAENDTATVYYNYRHYEPVMGRWLSRDPLENGGMINIYSFLDHYHPIGGKDTFL